MSTMEHFIRVINDALDQQLCDALIKKFHNSDNRHDGNIGGGVDTSKKRSQDLSPVSYTHLPLPTICSV